MALANKDSNEYKVKQLKEMLRYELQQPEEKQFGAHVTHWSGKAKPINIDAGAIEALIIYYGGTILYGDGEVE